MTEIIFALFHSQVQNLFEQLYISGVHLAPGNDNENNAGERSQNLSANPEISETINEE